jgi:hypothetical protein
MVILLMGIIDYSISGYYCIFYWWLLLFILLVAIVVYFIGGYYCLFYWWLLLIMPIVGYCWLFY